MNASRRTPWTRLAVAAVLVTSLVAMSPAALRADVIYNNFTPGYVPCCSGSLVRGPDFSAFPGSPLQTAVQFFTPSGSDYWLTQIGFAASWDSFLGGSNSIFFTLNSDAGGLPGGVLASWALNLPEGSGVAYETVTPSSPIELARGVPYWVVMAGVSDFSGVWITSEDYGLQDAANWGAGWVPFTAAADTLDVQGTPVPEPATLYLLVPCLLILKRRLNVTRSQCGG